MRLSSVLIAGLASVACAAPSFPIIDLKKIDGPAAAVEALSNYFNLIAYKAQAAKVTGRPPVCDVSTAQMPVGKHKLLHKLTSASTGGYWNPRGLTRTQRLSLCKHHPRASNHAISLWVEAPRTTHVQHQTPHLFPRQQVP